MIETLRENIYAITLTSPNEITPEIQVMLIKGEQEHLLIDAGFRSRSAYQQLITALDELGVCLCDVRLFLTHLHVDHSGNAALLAEHVKEVLASEWDGCMMSHDLNKTTQFYIQKNGELAGIPSAVYTSMMKETEVFWGPDQPFIFTPVHVGEMLTVGQYRFEIVSLAGHTPEQIGLYEADEKFMFTADALLNKIYPTINFWLTEFASMQDTFDTLKRIVRKECEVLYPSHYGPIEKAAILPRALATIDHHLKKEKILLEVLENHKGTAYELAMLIPWGRSLAAFDTFSCSKQWFAVLELMAHLERLVQLKRVVRTVHEGHYVYALTEVNKTLD